MTEEAGRRRRRRTASPADDDDILWEILLRLPPQPSSLLRASLVCRRWRRLATDPDFLRRFRSHHRKAPLLGFFMEYGARVSFTSILDAPDRIPCQRLSLRLDDDHDADIYPYGPYHGTFLGCHHGLVLVINQRRREVLVWEPITGGQRSIAMPPGFGMANGAVLCTARDQGHVHGGCQSSPFQVVLVRTSYTGGEIRAVACVYSSETGMWSNLISAVQGSIGYVAHRPCTLVGNSLYWWLYLLRGVEILEFDIGRQSLAVIDRLPIRSIDKDCSQIIQANDGRVGLAMLSYPSLHMWDMKVDCCGVATWVLRKTVNLELVLELGSIIIRNTAIVGYAEDDDAILLRLNTRVFMVQLESMQPRKLHISIVEHQYHPFSSFYTAGIASTPSTAPAIEPPEEQAPS